MVQFAYPLVQSFKKVFGATRASDWEYAQWMMHWVICGVWSVLESLFLWVLVDYFPFFLELKLLFFLWLMHPSFNGAAYLWYSVVQPLHKPIDAKLRPFVEKLEKAEVPKELKTDVSPPEGRNNDDVIESIISNGPGGRPPTDTAKRDVAPEPPSAEANPMESVVIKPKAAAAPPPAASE